MTRASASHSHPIAALTYTGVRLSLHLGLCFPPTTRCSSSSSKRQDNALLCFVRLRFLQYMANFSFIFYSAPIKLPFLSVPVSSIALMVGIVQLFALHMSVGSVLCSRYIKCWSNVTSPPCEPIHQRLNTDRTCAFCYPSTSR